MIARFERLVTVYGMNDSDAPTLHRDETLLIPHLVAVFSERTFGTLSGLNPEGRSRSGVVDTRPASG